MVVSNQITGANSLYLFTNLLYRKYYITSVTIYNSYVDTIQDVTVDTIDRDLLMAGCIT